MCSYVPEPTNILREKEVLINVVFYWRNKRQNPVFIYHYTLWPEAIPEASCCVSVAAAQSMSASVLPEHKSNNVRFILKVLQKFPKKLDKIFFNKQKISLFH
jgi:hypothetical protein